MEALLLFKASLLLSATLLVARLLRRAPASARHRLWTLAFAAVLALPLLAVALPSLYVPMPACCGAAISPAIEVPGSAQPLQPAVPQAGGAPVVNLGPSVSRISEPEKRQSAGILSIRPAARGLLLALWVGGALAAASVLMVSLIRVRRLARTADDIGDASWIASASALSTRLGLRRPVRLLVSPAVGTPMAGGVWRPAIFLPTSARGWTEEQRDVVLAHELAHLAGHDPLRHVAARLAVAFYWFHPLAWMAARQAVAAREQACDETVLALGTRPSAYARVLLDLAASMGPSPAGLGALSMVERSHLETRLMAILNNDSKVSSRRSVAIPMAAVVVCTLAVAAAQPGVRASAAHGPIRAVAAQNAGAAVPARPATAPQVVVTPKPAQLTEMWGRDATIISVNSAPSQTGAESACERMMLNTRSFHGSTSFGGDGRVYDMIGSTASDRIIARSLGDMRVCMLAEGAGPRVNNERPSQWPGRVPRVIMEARRGADVQRLEITSEAGAQRISWQVGGATRPFDAAAQQWRDRMLAALDTMWEVSILRGEVSNLHGAISNIHGEESNLRGEISNLRGHVSNLHGQISNVRGEESNLRGQISNIRGHVSNLQGAISSEQGRISSLRAGGYRLDDTAAVRDALKRHEDEIAKIEREIRDYGADAKVAAVEREIATLNADRQAQAIEAEIRKYDLNGKVAALEKQIAALDVKGKTARLQTEIAALDADRRVRELEQRRDDELKRLEAAIAAIR